MSILPSAPLGSPTTPLSVIFKLWALTHRKLEEIVKYCNELDFFFKHTIMVIVVP